MSHNLPNARKALHINILLLEAYSNMLLACLIEPMRVVRDEHGADIVWTVLTPNDEPVHSSSGLSQTPDRPLSEAKPCDLLILIGGDRFRSDANDPAVRRALRMTRKAGAVIAADTGAWLLADAGYLHGRRATLHWQLLTEFSETFPHVQAVSAPFVVDGRWMTCGSAAAAMELTLQEIARRFGAAARFDAAAMFLNGPRMAKPAEPAFGAFPSHPNPRLRQALDHMAAHIDRPQPLPEIAAAAGLTLRTMARLFEEEMRLSPGRCYLHMRLARAREHLLQPGLTRGEVAAMCG
ncbi:GlxA family transcriptional regulator, partial [Shinella sp.]|uniref:GlxA family transcriptional regulator n=1 Tax=Shinella sp. TaxID=1870904 RepID=UPI003F6FB6D2